MKVRSKTVRLDSYEEDAVIDGLNRVRTDMLNRNVCDRDVSDLMLKIMRSPTRKARKRDEAR